MSNKGKETDQPRKGERTTRRDQQPSKARKQKPQIAKTEHRSQGRKPDGQGTGQTAGASYRGGTNPTPEPHGSAERQGQPPQTAKQRPTSSPPARQATHRTTNHEPQPASTKGNERVTPSPLSLLSSLSSPLLAPAAPKKQQKHRHQGRNGSAVYERPKYKMDNHSFSLSQRSG